MAEGHNAQMWITPVQAGESFSAGGKEQVAGEDCIMLTIPMPGDSHLESLQLVIDAPTAFKIAQDMATAVGGLINSRVDDKGRPLTPWARLTALREKPSPLPPSLPEAVQEELRRTDISDQLRAKRACPACGKPVFRAVYPDGRATACSDPDCMYAHGIPALIPTPAPEELTRIDFDPDSSAEVEEPISFSRGAFGGPKMRHNHFTRAMKTDGSCPECNDYFDRHGIPEEEQ